MGFDATQPLRYSADQTLSFASIIGANIYLVYLVTFTFTGVSTPSNYGTKQRTNTRLLIGDGYESYAPADGYLNPNFRQLTAKEIFLSGGQFKDTDYKLGPMVYPYNTGFAIGGFDPNLFDPAIVPGQNLEPSLWVLGPGFPADGLYLAYVSADNEGSYLHTSIWRNTGNVLPVSDTDIWTYSQ